MTVTFFFQVTDTGMSYFSVVCIRVMEVLNLGFNRFVVGNWSVDQFLLYHVAFAGMVCGTLCPWGGVDGGHVGY